MARTSKPKSNEIKIKYYIYAVFFDVFYEGKCPETFKIVQAEAVEREMGGTLVFMNFDKLGEPLEVAAFRSWNHFKMITPAEALALQINRIKPSCSETSEP